MSEMTWPQWSFVFCFALFGVGGTWWVGSESLSGAVVTLVAMTLLGTAVWFALLYAVRRAGKGTKPPPPGR